MGGLNEIYITENNIAITEELQKSWRNLLKVFGKLYIYAPSGYGKTSTVMAFAGKQFSEWKNISAKGDNFLQRAEECIKKYVKTRIRTLIVFDDLQWIGGKEEQDRFVELLASIHGRENKLQCVLISRAPLPPYLKPFYLTRQMEVNNADSLRLNEKQIQGLFRRENLSSDMEESTLEELAKRCESAMRGYPIAVCSFIRLWKEGFREFESIICMVREDIYQYFDRTLWVTWNIRQKSALLKLAVYEKFNRNMAEWILGDEAGAVIESILSISSFFQYTSPDAYKFQPFFLQYLKGRQDRLSWEERSLLYFKAGQYYERNRELKQALACYKQAKNYEKIVELIITLSENVDGDFIRISNSYLEELPEELDERNPNFLGAKALLYSYQMRIEESNRYLKKLKRMAIDEKKRGKRGEVLRAYARVMVAIPHGNSDDVRSKLTFLSRYLLKHGTSLPNIIPTGNMPSVINGGLDFLRWEKNDRLLYPVMKRVVEIALGKEAVGIADVCMGENLYEKNRRSEAMGYLAKGLSEANLKGSIRVQFAAVGAMARMFLSDGQIETAEGTLQNIMEKAERIKSVEIIPNVRASIVNIHLMKGNSSLVIDWVQKFAPDEYGTFYTIDRYSLFTKAKVYISLGRDVEALYILNILLEYTERYDRTYFGMEINILKCLILYRSREEWKNLFIETVRNAAKYSYVHILSDQGAALLPLWKEMDWSDSGLNSTYMSDVSNEMKRMASIYPDYLKEKQEAEVVSRKEAEVLQVMAKGYTNAEIGKELGISTATVKFHIANLLRKLNVENRVLAVKKAHELHLL
ncbi:MAG TPA: LuxR C-terminal-related transcriptional regulator [Lachnospiraceae bacterium]|nr:LuxR C-terminal-related transcriptional regulator [Lachnospiraceae bacterium]